LFIAPPLASPKQVVVFVNGLPLALIELKNPGDENATVKGAFNQ
jgi:type I restriction enzyme R subunit